MIMGRKTFVCPMTETNTLYFGHRFDCGVCSKGTRFAPTFILGHIYLYRPGCQSKKDAGWTL